MIGVILCGGQSTRMGADKGLLTSQAGTWAQIAANKMDALHLPVIVSVNKEQYDLYAAIFSTSQLVKDNETIGIKGPLGGVLSVHINYPAEDLFLLACDMPLMETPVLKQLLNSYSPQTAAAFIFTNEGEPEPLCGIYTAKGLSHILQLLQTKQLLKHSMKYMLEHVKTISIPLAADQKAYFRNFNAHAELNGL